MTKEQLLQLKNMKLSAAERVDIMDAEVDPDLPAAKRREQYISQLKNPYAFKCGDIAINICFSEDAGSLEDAVASYLKALQAE